MMVHCRLQAFLPNPLRRFFLPNVILLPTSAHKSVSPLYQFLVLTHPPPDADDEIQEVDLVDPHLVAVQAAV
jgi:hypothetical protein